MHSVNVDWTWLQPDCSIRIPTDQCLLTAPRGFSQFAASFFGSQCQGIPLALFVAWPCVLTASCFRNCRFTRFKLLFISRLSASFLYSVFKVPFLSRLPALVGLSGLEPPTSRLSGVRSNQLSYKPIEIFRSLWCFQLSLDNWTV